MQPRLRRQRLESGTRPDLRPVEGREADTDLADLAKALGHVARVHILRALRARGSATVTELVRELRLAQSTVSEHLRVLRDAGLVTDAPNLGSRRYAVEVHHVRRLKALVGSL